MKELTRYLIQGALLRASRPYPNACDLDFLTSVFGRPVLSVQLKGNSMHIRYADEDFCLRRSTDSPYLVDFFIEDTEILVDKGGN
jgi:hypothetical protein